MFHERTGGKSKLLVATGLAVYFLLAARSLSRNNQLDLFVYRTGAALALNGQSPYDTQRMRVEIAETFPPKTETDIALNCGFFLPPQGIVLFAPFAKMESWSGAEAGWFFVLTLFGICCGTLAWTFGRDPAHQGFGWAVVVLAVLLNPIAQLSLVVGQTTLLFAGCIALGQYCFEDDCPRLGCFLWAMTFFKPHLALPFLVLAGVLGGWKRVAGIVFLVAILNLAGGLLARNSIGGAGALFREYVEYLGTGRESVQYNLVAENFQIVSWNRILAALDGPAIDLKITMTLAGFAVWAALIAVRLRLPASWRDNFDRQKLDAAYGLAVTIVASLFFAQVLAYELILLVLLTPLILQAFDANRRFTVWALIGIVFFLVIPISVMDRIADLLRLPEYSRGRTLLRSHKCFGMAGLAIFLLIRGPIKKL